MAFLDHEGGGVAEFAHVLESLENVLLCFFVVAAGAFGERLALFFGKVFEELLLEVAEVAVVVLQDFGGKIVEDFLF